MPARHKKRTKRERRASSSSMAGAILAPLLPIILILGMIASIIFGAGYLISNLPDLRSMLGLDPKKRNIYEVGDGDHDYTLTVNTGTSADAGTDANIRVTIFGKKETKSIFSGNTEETFEKTKPLLLNSFIGTFTEDAFENGDSDLIQITKTVDVGIPTKIKVTMDNSFPGSAWALDSLELSTKINGKPRTFFFPHNGTLGGGEDLPKSIMLENEGEPTNYKFIFKIRDCYECGTDSETHITLTGDLGDLDRFEITSQINETGKDSETALSRGQQEDFEYGPKASVGDLKEILVETGSSDQLNLEWIKVEMIPQTGFSEKTTWKATFPDSKFSSHTATFIETTKKKPAQAQDEPE